MAAAGLSAAAILSVLGWLYSRRSNRPPTAKEIEQSARLTPEQAEKVTEFFNSMQGRRTGSVDVDALD